MSVKSLNEVLRRVNRGSHTDTHGRSESISWGDAEKVLDWVNLSRPDIEEIKKILGNPNSNSSLSSSEIVSAVREATTDNTASEIEKELKSNGYESRRHAEYRSRRGRYEEDDKEKETFDFRDFDDDKEKKDKEDESHAHTRGGAGRRGRVRGRKRYEEDGVPWGRLEDDLAQAGVSSEGVNWVFSGLGSPSENDKVDMEDVLDCLIGFFDGDEKQVHHILSNIRYGG
jgi:hypothetical protein